MGYIVRNIYFDILMIKYQHTLNGKKEGWNYLKNDFYHKLKGCVFIEWKQTALYNNIKQYKGGII